MRIGLSGLALVAANVLAVAAGFAAPSAQAQITPIGPNVNVSQKTGDDNECAVAINPANKDQMFVMCNTTGAGLFAARSDTRGASWTYPQPSKIIADGTVAFGPTACCDPSLAWDSFGNLFLVYIDQGVANIVVLLSQDGGKSFSLLTKLPGSVDQPTVTVGPGTTAGSNTVWIVYDVGGSIVATGAPVTGLGAIGSFITPLSANAPNCDYGDVAISPKGVVVQACETPTGGNNIAGTLVFSANTGGLTGTFGALQTVTSTNVGPWDFIAPQNTRSVDAEVGLAYDRNPASPHFGRLYMVYTDSTAPGNSNTTINLRTSDNDGGAWTAPANVDTDLSAHARFLPKIAANDDSGNIAICWHDTRGSASNNQMREFCTAVNRLDPSPVFQTSAQVGDGFSLSNGAGVEFGDFSGLAYWKGVFAPVWADTSNSTGDNPNGTANFDIYTNSTQWNPIANEGDPHITTAEGGHYNFQSAGEFTALRDTTGLVIQTRQSPTSTFGPYFDPYTGLTTCVSLNTAMAARVGKPRVTYEPIKKNGPFVLRVDGRIVQLPAGGMTLAGGGRLSDVGGSLRIDFPDGTVLVATPNFAAPQWYLNIDVYRTLASEGIMGSIAHASWLPALANGSSVGMMPASLHQRFVTLNQTYADSWRVSNATSLFDYAPGTSTATFTDRRWPPERGSCVPPGAPRPAPPIPVKQAMEICDVVRDRYRREDCVFDVAATGERGFAKGYGETQHIQQSGTIITVGDNLASLSHRETKPVPYFSATVRRLVAGGATPTGRVQFILDGERLGDPVRLEPDGRAYFKPSLKPGRYRLSARYGPEPDSKDLPSESAERIVVFGEPR